jgi:hypothetical protein
LDVDAVGGTSTAEAAAACTEAGVIVDGAGAAAVVAGLLWIVADERTAFGVTRVNKGKSDETGAGAGAGVAEAEGVEGAGASAVVDGATVEDAETAAVGALVSLPSVVVEYGSPFSST